EVPRGANGMLHMKTFFARPDGWAVISGKIPGDRLEGCPASLLTCDRPDIDDTIKITQTSDPIGILRTTFLEEPTPVQGMPQLYSYIQSQIVTTSPFFYLSASPYNLYPFLRG